MQILVLMTLLILCIRAPDWLWLVLCGGYMLALVV